MRDDDPGVGNLGLNIRMGGENFSVAQQTFTDHPDPEGETPQEKIQRGKQILRAMRDDDPGVGNLGLNINMDG